MWRHWRIYSFFLIKSPEINHVFRAACHNTYRYVARNDRRNRANIPIPPAKKYRLQPPAGLNCVGGDKFPQSNVPEIQSLTHRAEILGMVVMQP